MLARLSEKWRERWGRHAVLNAHLALALGVRSAPLTGPMPIYAFSGADALAIGLAPGSVGIARGATVGRDASARVYQPPRQPPDVERQRRSQLSENGAAVSFEELSGEALLAAIYVEYSAAIHTYASRLLDNQEDADDVTQEVFIRANAHLSQLREAGRLRPWLYRIATNLCMDALRRRSRIRKVFGLTFSLGATLGDDEGPLREIPQPGASAAIESVGERDHILQTLKRMPPKYATCLLLHSEQGLSYREIAEAVGITPGAAAVRLSRARNLFGKYYEELRSEGFS